MRILLTYTILLLAAVSLPLHEAHASGPSYGSRKSGSAKSSSYVSGYRRSNGTYVPSHYRSTADHSFHNNWSTKPNYTPYTGSRGTRITPPRR